MKITTLLLRKKASGEMKLNVKLNVVYGFLFHIAFYYQPMTSQYNPVYCASDSATGTIAYGLEARVKGSSSRSSTSSSMVEFSRFSQKPKWNRLRGVDLMFLSDRLRGVELGGFQLGFGSCSALRS
ncbi:hypothetical protein L6452_01470 [Arctium lappa]|uniref:Uncharacterized protein n=1 Tax=Arctium lappa TaxID=4217 RepID=A0ACB9FGR6_ARCLA|nr:hypothetical protein L6452_01470 [Arctium lappa]